jgi:hypothetical protein
MGAVQVGIGEQLIELDVVRTLDDLLEGDQIGGDPTKFRIAGLGSSGVAFGVLHVEG